MAAAIVATSTMDATGASTFSSLALCPLLAIFWYLQRFSASQIGFSWGRSRVAQCYALAVVFPVVVMALLAGIAALTGALNPAAAPHHKTSTWMMLLIITGTTIPIALVTEEGFFRGWLWASLRRAGAAGVATLILSSLAFALWHWSAVLLPTGYNPPLAQVPTFMLNAVTLGAIWGMLRKASGSIVVSSVSHGVWNGLAYVLFGFGSNAGALGIANTALYGPEVGVAGLALNPVVAALLWRWCVT
ncbi:MAG TPA: CPBP family glutamic-type intramembrane protease [Candidatus Baltobacteraceae bacterium]|nr:CPBP family glutamic-type intramembrane protease [Candidatus Baltobacteraceae bacterium]